MNDKPRLIDANGLYDECVMDSCDTACFDNIKNAPTIDAVPVVRCENCGYRYPEKCLKKQYFCSLHKVLRKHDDYCSQGYAKMDGKDGE